MADFEGIGIIEEKSEAISKNGKYWKFKIKLQGQSNPRTFNLFKYEDGNNASVGDKIKLIWVENKGENQIGEEIIYKNLKSIIRIESSSVQKEESIGGGRLSYNEGARIGMLFNNAIQLCISENKRTAEDIEERFLILKKLLDKLENDTLPK